MRITFVGIGWEQLGVSLLSAIAKTRGHTVNLAFSVALFNDRCHLTVPSLANIFDDHRDVVETIRRQQPDVLVCSPVSGTYQAMLAIVRDAKKNDPRMKVVFGGVHTTAVPERVLAQPEIDYVCVGEGDVAFPLILDAIASGGASAPIPNTRFKQPDGCVVRGEQTGFIQDLDSLPVFDKTLWEDYMRYGDSFITMASRGCPYRCTYCFNSFFANLPDGKKGKYVRYRSPEHVMYELRAAKKRYGFRILEFFDDVFTMDLPWLRRFTAMYREEIGIPYQIFTHVQYLDEERVRLLAEGGCRSAQIGVQSMDDAFKRVSLKRTESTDQVERVIKLMNKYKVLPKFDHMFGLPGEPLEAQEKARAFYVQTPPYRIQTYWLNLYPGTVMQRQALERGMITAQDVEDLNDGKDLDSFTRSNKLIAPDKVRAYKAYETIFKLIPALPAFWRRRLKPETFMHMPAGVCALLTFVADVAIGFLRWDIDHRVYAQYYLYHMFRSLARRMGIKVGSGTRPRGEMTPLAVPGLTRDHVSEIVARLREAHCDAG